MSLRFCSVALALTFGVACSSGERPSSTSQAVQVWVEQQKLTLSPAPSSLDGFGSTVALGASTALVASPFEASDSGAVYVFERNGSSWVKQQRLVSSDLSQYDAFGYAVSLSADSALVGAFQKEAAYVFTRVGATWTQQQKLLASDHYVGDHFGGSVAIDGDTAVAGAVGKISGPGAAYVYTRSGTTWTEQQRLAASDAGTARNNFGQVVSISGNTVLVTAPAGASGGAAYVFVRNGATWTEQQKLTPSVLSFGQTFGYAAELDGDTVLVSSTDPAVFVFVRSGTTWTEQQRLTPSDTDPASRFGWALSFRGDTGLVGASGYKSGLGRAYVFSRSGTTWTETKKLDASEPSLAWNFGSALATTGGDALIGTADSGAHAFHVGGSPGDTCVVDHDCALGVCSAEGVCCDAACAGPCQSCIAARKASGPAGECGAVKADTDPRGACPAEAASSCGTTGLCDGAGACRLYAADTVCAPASCPTPTSEHLRDACDGQGQCVVTAQSACLPGHLCSAGACNVTCAADADCDADQGFVCGTGECKVPSAQPCASDDDCGTGHCADGLCCDKACQGQCEACAESGHEGICVAVAGAPRGTSRKACDSAGDPSCAARCDGAERASCQYVPSTVSCACAGANAADFCDGQGYCTVGHPSSCEGFVCSGDACLTECAVAEDCSTGFRCADSKCVPAGGAKCSDDLGASIEDDRSTPCAPYQCDLATGACLVLCSNSADCQGRAVCDPVRQICTDVEPTTQEDGCGCRAVGKPAGDGRGLVLLLALGVAARFRSRRGPRR